MERGSRVLWAAGVAAIPAVLLLGMLFFELKKIEIVNQDLDAELQLGRQHQQRLALERAMEEHEGGGKTASEPEPAPAQAG